MEYIVELIEKLESILLPQHTLVNESYSFLFLIFLLFIFSVLTVNIIASLINLLLKWQLRRVIRKNER